MNTPGIGWSKRMGQFMDRLAANFPSPNGLVLRRGCGGGQRQFWIGAHVSGVVAPFHTITNANCPGHTVRFHFHWPGSARRFTSYPDRVNGKLEFTMLYTQDRVQGLAEWLALFVRGLMANSLECLSRPPVTLSREFVTYGSKCNYVWTEDALSVIREAESRRDTLRMGVERLTRCRN